MTLTEQYWIEKVQESFDGVGLIVTPEIIKSVAEDMQEASEEMKHE